ncbi:acyl carrier protein [Streptomyces sp. YIM B13518]|uniref:acyl carrier protein n=1 Tax=Streptomyces sp. YIM B13518 TaxID=3366316 RepID=UPI00368AC73F
MPVQEVFDLVVKHTCEVMPELDGHTFVATDSLRELGANSMDRAEIIMMTLEELSLTVPLVELAGANNIGELAKLIHDKS